MSLFGQLRLFYSCFLSKPRANRSIYRAIRRRHVRKIVELGIGDGGRALRMIAVARQVLAAEHDVRYVGFDRFEDRVDQAEPQLTLKQAHRLILGTKVKARLVPGEPSESLIRVANTLGKVDLMILPVELESPSAARFWFFVPRLLDDDSIVLIERKDANGERSYEELSHRTIENLAALGAVRRAA